MASNPAPFLVEDTTDEDFFDKLVNDDDAADFKLTRKASAGSVRSDGNESDDVRSLASLRINDLVNDEGINHGKAGGGAEMMRKFGVLDNNKNSLDALASQNLTHRLENEVGAPKVSTDLAAASMSVVNKSSIEAFDTTTLVSKRSGDLETPGVKEVGWSAFCSDSDGNDGNGIGSYLNFFSELGDNSGSGIVGHGGGDGLKSRSDVSIQNGADGSTYLENVNSTGLSTDVEDSNSWKNEYPGWKYDSGTGQWYNVDGHDASGNVQTGIDEKAMVPHMEKDAGSASGTDTPFGTGSVTHWNQETAGNWNQISQVSGGTTVVQSDWDHSFQEYNGYPSHIVFDPQYPGWYYDTIAQEWRPLESYNESVHSTARVQEQIHYNKQEDIVYNHGNIYDTQYQGMTQPINYYHPNNSSTWQPNNFTSVDAQQCIGDQLVSMRAQNGQNTVYHGDPGAYHQNFGQGLNDIPMLSRTNQYDQRHISTDYISNQDSLGFSQKQEQSSLNSCAPTTGRSSAGRPPHALVGFGFGGKIIVLKDGSSTGNFDSQTLTNVGSSILVLNIAEVINHNSDTSDHRRGVCSYYQALCQQCVPGPLSGGSVGIRELNKWIDERIANSSSADVDHRRSEVLKLLLALLKITCQYYGKLRTPYAASAVSKESDGPEFAIAKLFASAKINGSQYDQYDMASKCLQLQHMPPEDEIRATAAEIQTLLVSGRKKEALKCAQEGQLWGTAIVLAAELGNQFYVETVKQMALRLFVGGSPLRTLCLLIAGQPADVFSTESTAISTMAGSVNMTQQPHQSSVDGMLDDWTENLAVITANRTKDDELVLMHLGDCLWRERNDITAAHICYLVAEASIEPYSDTARMCLIGADHWKFPRTYASPQAIQRTEIYEYSKTLGNSQFVLLPFQPYKLIYAHMLAEFGKISDALKYCQVILKSLKTGRTPEVETLRHLVSSLEERLKSHQQGVSTTNLAPKKFVDALLNLFDSTANRVVGSVPTRNGANHQLLGHRVSTSQSTLAMSLLLPSQSLEPLNGRAADRNGKLLRTRSISEPDFGRSPR